MSEALKLPVISAISDPAVGEKTEIRQQIAQFGPLPVYPQQQYIRAPASIPPAPQPPTYPLERIIPVPPVHSSPFLGDTWSQVGYQSVNVPLPLPEPIIVPQAPHHSASTPFTPLPIQTAPSHSQVVAQPPQSSFSLPLPSPALPPVSTTLTSVPQTSSLATPASISTPSTTASVPSTSLTTSTTLSSTRDLSSTPIPDSSPPSSAPLPTFVQKPTTDEKEPISPPSTPGSDGLVRVEELREVDGSPRILVAILVKDMEHYLPFYLQCLYDQDYDKKKLHLWIRTNNNKTEVPTKILERWIAKYGREYANVIYDKSDVKEKVERFDLHDWNPERFKVLGEIRNESISYAKEHGLDYFVCDIDNLVGPETLYCLSTNSFPVSGPMLRRGNTNYSNYHHTTNSEGYFTSEDQCYFLIKDLKIKGWIEVDVIHCTYYIKHEFLRFVKYTGGNPKHHEYVTMANGLRRDKVLQIMDNTHIFGLVGAAKNFEELVAEISLFMEEFKSHDCVGETVNLKNLLKATIPYHDILGPRAMSSLLGR